MARATTAASLALLLCAGAAAGAPPGWSAAERAQVGALSLSRLGPPPGDPGNRHADDPRAAALGRELFSDPRLSRNGQLACASCHQATRRFTDGLPRSVGLRPLPRNAPSLLAAAWSPWQFWDGRADSLWMQALSPLLGADELGLSAAAVRDVIGAAYREPYERIFGPLARDGDERMLANVGKALAAFERTLRPAPTRFDTFADALARGEASDALTGAEQAGLRLFMGKAQCLRCHHGPLLTNQGFHNTGLGKLPDLPTDPGRLRGVREVQTSAFNCRGPHSDDPQRRCPHLDYLRPDATGLLGAFKVPSLRHVAETAPYMHDGRFATLAQVIDHYDRAPGVHASAGHSELFPLALTAGERGELESFLRALSPGPGYPSGPGGHDSGLR